MDWGSCVNPVTLIGPRGEWTVTALVDSMVTHTVLPWPLLFDLGVRPQSSLAVPQADGRNATYAQGALRIRINDEERATRCLFGEAESEPLIGADTLERFVLGASTPFTTGLIARGDANSN